MSLDTLFQIAGAGDGACAFPRFAQRRKQHGSEDGDDRNYDKKFYKSKKWMIPLFWRAFPVLRRKGGFMDSISFAAWFSDICLPFPVAF
ncbi:MAG: hypothetical protein L6W00_28375 [Lentisphaeria bacterium]|nr:MAG: hypothetical protein L6W00_28375 [Lentisphaeria bacterium]